MGTRHHRPLGSPSLRSEVSCPLISVVLPAHNEAEGIGHTLEVIGRVLREADLHHELIVVDDGSHDGTFARVSAVAGVDPRVRGLRFSRNFGKEAALMAGLREAHGHAAVTMDADLQHPPELIPEMVRRWREGAWVVHGVKQRRAGDPPLVRLRAWAFNGLLQRLGKIDLHNASDFKLLDRAVVDVLIHQLPERERFYRGLTAWIGFPQASVPFDVGARNAGSGKWSLLALTGLAVTGVLSFTSAPLRLVTLLGLITLVLAAGVGGEALWSWMHGRAVSGFATVILTLLILGSFIMISLGIVGEYLAKLYEEIKVRPPYLIEARCGLDMENEPASTASRQSAI
jgi:polyisoprenyl-phosphate glycosyltransferase